MNIESEIIEALHGQSLTCSQIARHIGINAFKCREWLETLIGWGDVEQWRDRNGHTFYRLPGENQGPGSAA